MERFLPITQLVVVFNVVVDKRSFVKAFDGDGDFAKTFGEDRFWHGLQRLTGGDGQEGTPAFASPGQPFAPNLFGLAFSRSHQFFQ